MSRLFTSDDQNTGASALASVLTNKYSGLISLKIDWFDLLAVQWAFRSLLQHHSLKALNLTFCLLYGPALTTTRDRWEDHSLGYMDLCWQSNVSAFQHTV